MNIFKVVLILIFALFSMNKPVHSQTCDCESHFEWVKETFEANDAGYAITLEKKGIEAYQRQNEETSKRITETENLDECLEALEDWLLFFRKGHIGIQRTSSPDKESELSKKEIRAEYQDWEQVDWNLNKLRKELTERENDGFEGVWETGVYRIAILEQEGEYLGVILKADGVYWRPGQIKLKITPRNEGFSSVYYMRDHSESHSESVRLLDANHLSLGDIDLFRAKPKQASLPATVNYFKAMEASTPYLQALDDNTHYLRLPSFGLGYKAAIDKLMIENKEAILNKPYLIIDLRNNSGGSDDSYLEVLPYLYTSPIKVVGVSFLASPLNISTLEELSNNPKLDEETKEVLAELIPKLRANEGSFVNLEEEEISYVEMEEVYPQPQKVAILINESNASAAEQFILEASQSSKVQLFGRNTAGILDISNVNIIESPSKDFVLAYSMSKSFRIPEEAIDDVGITPDVVIPKEIPDHQWVEFVMQRMKDE